MDQIFQNITESFGALWHCVRRGNTIEVVTPYATINDKFVSVFITKQGAEYVVTDGGWCSTNEYEVNPNKDKAYTLFVNHYEKEYQIRTLGANNAIAYYYKTTTNSLLIPSLVFDLCNFISSIISATFVSFEDVKEKEVQTRFKTSVNDFISTLVPIEKRKFGECVSQQYSDVRFSAVIMHTPSSLTVVSYITGSTPYYFGNSLTKANSSIEIIQESLSAKYIKQYIAIIDNQAKGCEKGGHGSFYNSLLKKTGDKAINWTEKESLGSLLVC